MADYGRVLLLSVHAPLGPGRDDAAAVRRLWPERDERCLAGGTLLLVLLPVQPLIPTTIFDMVWGVRYLQEDAQVRLCVGGDSIVDGIQDLTPAPPARRPAADY